MRQIVLDTETTGLEPKDGHRIIEIGCVEIVKRRITEAQFHYYLNPQREVDAGAQAVHGLSNEFLADKPLFGDIAGDFIDFVKDAQLVIHNAPFDMGFLNHELNLLGQAPLETHCSVLDTLVLARKQHPGQKNSLDALCKRYSVDNSNRELHGALLDSQILAEVYLAMTGGQTSLLQDKNSADGARAGQEIRRVASERPRLATINPAEEELAAHENRLAALDKKVGGSCLWRSVASTS
jgi:DNA polymerase-3 subunit epsilon